MRSCGWLGAWKANERYDKDNVLVACVLFLIFCDGVIKSSILNGCFINAGIFRSVKYYLMVF